MRATGRPDEPLGTVSLVVLTAGHPFRSVVLDLAPTEDQEAFSGRARDTLPAADADPQRTPFALAVGGSAVGFGVLDRLGILPELVDQPERAALLRGFYVDAAHQGRGLGTAAARAVPELAAALYGDVDLVVLTVNHGNPGAVAAYRRGGWVDTGVSYLGGDLGPQHVLVSRVPRPAPRTPAGPATS